MTNWVVKVFCILLLKLDLIVASSSCGNGGNGGSGSGSSVYGSGYGNAGSGYGYAGSGYGYAGSAYGYAGNGSGSVGSYGYAYAYAYGYGDCYACDSAASGGCSKFLPFKDLVSAVKFITGQNFFRIIKVFFSFFSNTGRPGYSLDYAPFQEGQLLDDVIFGLSLNQNVTLSTFITQTFNITWKARFAVYTELLVTMNPQEKEDFVNYWSNSFTVDKKTEHHESVSPSGKEASASASASITIKKRPPFPQSIFEAFNQTNFQDIAMKLAWSKRDKEDTDYSADGNKIVDGIVAEVKSNFNQSMDNTNKLLFNCSKKFAEQTLKQLKNDHQIDLLDKIKQLNLAPEIIFVYQSLVDCIPYVSGYIANRMEECSRNDSLDVTHAAWIIFLTSDNTNMGRIRAEYKHQFNKELITLFERDEKDRDYSAFKLLAMLSKH